MLQLPVLLIRFKMLVTLLFLFLTVTRMEIISPSSAITSMATAGVQMKMAILFQVQQ